jgi:hypothetical protein
MPTKNISVTIDDVVAVVLNLNYNSHLSNFLLRQQFMATVIEQYTLCNNST